MSGVAQAAASDYRPSGYVNDFANVIDDTTQASLETDLTAFKTQTSNEIVVATVPDLGGDAIEVFSNELFRRWGVGTKEKNNGLLIVVSVGDKRARIEVGSGLEGAIPDLLAGRIVDNEMLPKFKQADYGGGITGAVGALKLAARGEYNEPAVRTTQSAGVNISDVLFWGTFIMLWLSSFLARSKSIWAGGLAGGLIGLIGVFVLSTTFLKSLGFVSAVLIGLVLDWLVSRTYQQDIKNGGDGGFRGTHGGFWGGGSGRGGGFGGFGGGSSGGGGASGSW